MGPKTSPLGLTPAAWEKVDRVYDVLESRFPNESIEVEFSPKEGFVNFRCSDESGEHKTLSLMTDLFYRVELDALLGVVQTWREVPWESLPE